MTRTELMEIVTDRICDPWTYCAEDIAVCDPIGIDEAKNWLAEYRKEDEDFEPEDRLPAEVTPEMLMISWNCLIQKARYDLRVERFAEWLTKHEEVVLYDNYRPEGSVEVIPVDLLYNTRTFPFDFKFMKQPDVVSLIRIGQRSPEFNGNDSYCWYDPDKMVLRSSDTPFKDGVIDAQTFAEHVMKDPDHECLKEALEYMDDEDVVLTFGCGREEVFA